MIKILEKMYRSSSNTYFDHEDDWTLFQRRLSETRSWCETRGMIGDTENSLRTPTLKPTILIGTGIDIYWNYKRKDERAVVSELCEKRSELLLQSSSGTPADSGILLFFWPEESLNCGAASLKSKGYFDNGNQPPWVTWFWFGPIRNESPALVSYVPSDFVALVEAGISDNPEKCLRLTRNIKISN